MDTLRGVVERLTFHSEETGYTVARLMPEGRDHSPFPNREVTIVGNMAGINVGEFVELSGRWTVHADYGKQFQVEQMRSVLPATVAGIEKYLGSGLVKGVGPVTARRIVRRFGVATLDIIEQTPERLVEVPGVGDKRLRMIVQAWAEQRAIKEVMIFLQSHGVSTSLATKIYKAYGDAAKVPSLVAQHSQRIREQINAREHDEVERLEAEYADIATRLARLETEVAESHVELAKISGKTAKDKAETALSKLEAQRDKAAAKIAERDEKIAEVRRRAEDDRRDVEQVGVELGALYGDPDELLKHARVVGIDEIEENEFNLNIPRYVDTFEPEPRVEVKEALSALRTAETSLQCAETELLALLQKAGYAKEQSC